MDFILNQSLFVDTRDSKISTFTLVIRCGSKYDPLGKNGMATVLSNVLGHSTLTMTRTQLIDYLNSNMCQFEVDVDRDFMTISIKTTKHPSYAIMIMRDIIMTPVFDDALIDTVKSQAIGRLGAWNADIDALENERYWKLAYDSSYGFPVLGTTETITSITVNDVLDHWKTMFVNGNLVFGYSGPYSADDISKEMTAFNQLPQGVAPISPMVNYSGGTQTSKTSTLPFDTARKLIPLPGQYASNFGVYIMLYCALKHNIDTIIKNNKALNATTMCTTDLYPGENNSSIVISACIEDQGSVATINEVMDHAMAALKHLASDTINTLKKSVVLSYLHAMEDSAIGRLQSVMTAYLATGNTTLPDVVGQVEQITDDEFKQIVEHIQSIPPTLDYILR